MTPPPPAHIVGEPLAAVDMGVDALPGRRLRRDFGQIVRFIRFAIVGGLASIVYLGLFAAMVTAGVHYLIAGTIGYLAAIATNFTVNREWTFGHGVRAIHVQAISFLGVQLTIGAMNLTLLHALVVWGVEPIILAQLLTCAALFPINFLASQRWGFR
jgi:putative flippase GtrA